jgi:ribulose-phosphate 3-epimerase
MPLIIPAILAKTEEDYEVLVSELNAFDELKNSLVQIDFTDGIFVNSKTTYWDVFDKYPLNYEIEAHLMVQEPLSFLTRLSSYRFKRVVFHIEVGNTEEIIRQIKERHMEVGLALNPETSLDSVVPYLSQIDVLLILGVNPGFGGQEFKSEVLDKVKEAFKLRNEGSYSFKIEVDGGVNETTISAIQEAGADLLVVGSALSKGNIDENYRRLKNAIQN